MHLCPWVNFGSGFLRSIPTPLIGREIKGAGGGLKVRHFIDIVCISGKNGGFGDHAWAVDLIPQLLQCVTGSQMAPEQVGVSQVHNAVNVGTWHNEEVTGFPASYAVVICSRPHKAGGKERGSQLSDESESGWRTWRVGSMKRWQRLK